MSSSDASKAPSRNPEAVDWTAAKRVFAEALELSPERRGGLLDEQLAEDPETRRRVALLLEAHARTDGFLVEPMPRPPAGPAMPALPERIGPYRPVERLGEGGFGVVYRAEQVEPIERQVALKVLKPGVDTPEMLARFADERQYLAKLDHGDVVKVFDAGIDEAGRTFIAMELVEGEPITEFATPTRAGSAPAARPCPWIAGTAPRAGRCGSRATWRTRGTGD